MDNYGRKMNTFLVGTAAVNTAISIVALVLAVDFARTGDLLGAGVVAFWALVSLFGAAVAVLTTLSDDPFLYPFGGGL